MLAALLNVPANLGYPILGVLVGAEAAGAFVPGETSLIVAGTFAAQGRLTLTIVIAVAAGAAIIGDNVGYQLGRRGLRRLFERRSRGRARSARVFARGEAFFQRHGPAAVFFGRWVPGLRVLASWLPARTECRGAGSSSGTPSGGSVGRPLSARPPISSAAAHPAPFSWSKPRGSRSLRRSTSCAARAKRERRPASALSQVVHADDENDHEDHERNHPTGNDRELDQRPSGPSDSVSRNRERQESVDRVALESYRRPVVALVAALPEPTVGEAGEEATVDGEERIRHRRQRAG
jgi:membrane protein YqaA with SNARE-associated domain